MPGPFSPGDTLIGPIIHELAVLIRAQLPDVGYIFEEVADRAPSDNQILLPMIKAKILDDTNGKIKILLTIGMKHVFRRRELDQGIQQVYTWIMPWLLFLSAWENQTLNGLAIDVTPTDLSVQRIVESGQVYIALAIDFNVLTEFNIALN